MRVLEGSHRELADHWQSMQELGAKGLPLPVAHGPRWESPGEPDARRWAGREPTPMTARRGEALVWSQQVLHSAWHNADTQPRSGFFASWVAAGVSIRGRSAQQIAASMRSGSNSTSAWRQSDDTLPWTKRRRGALMKARRRRGRLPCMSGTGCET